MGQAPKYVLFLDDSGTKEYDEDGAYDVHNTRHFVFGGPLLRYAESRRLGLELAAIKRARFGTERVEIKSNWLRIETMRRNRYLDRFGISDADLTAFVNEFYGAVLRADLCFVAGVVDKQHMQETYKAPWYPPAMAYEAVAQRAQSFVRDAGEPSTSVRVVIDSMDGATPKGRKYHENLKRHHAQLKKTGSQLLRGFLFPCLEEIAFVDSSASHLIQVADLIAYNVYRQFRDHGEAWEDATLRVLPTYDWFRRVLVKFRHDGNGRIQGFGVVKMPLLTRVRWAIPVPAGR